MKILDNVLTGIPQVPQVPDVTSRPLTRSMACQAVGQILEPGTCALGGVN